MHMRFYFGSAVNMEQALSFKFSGKSAFGVLIFMPIPIIQAKPSGPLAISQSMPAIFPSPIYRSLGHFIVIDEALAQ